MLKFCILSCPSYKDVQTSCRDLLRKAKYKPKKLLSCTVTYISSQNMRLISGSKAENQMLKN